MDARLPQHVIEVRARLVNCHEAPCAVRGKKSCANARTFPLAHFAVADKFDGHESESRVWPGRVADRISRWAHDGHRAEPYAGIAGRKSRGNSRARTADCVAAIARTHRRE